MARGIERLSERSITAIKAKGRVGDHADGAGLYLKKTAAGTTSWVFRYSRHGRARHLGLGPLYTVSLIEARAEARKLRQLILAGRDPATVRAESKPVETTFREVRDAWLAKGKEEWSAKHLGQVESELRRFAEPLANVPIAEIRKRDIIGVVEPIWLDKNSIASKVRAHLEGIMARAIARDLHPGPNPAKWEGNLDQLLPSPNKLKRARVREGDDGHFAALPHAEIGDFMSKLRAVDGDPARVIELAILTANRLGAVLKADWSEFDLDKRVWTVPAGNMKTAKEHPVPLSDAAIAALGAPGSGPVFNVKFASYCNKQLKKLRPGVTVHGFRSTFKDWAAEMTSFSVDVVEKALAHEVGNLTERAYGRSNLFDRRRQLMSAWADYCAKPATGQVIAIGSAR